MKPPNVLNHPSGWVQVSATLLIGVLTNLLAAWWAGTPFPVVEPFLVMNAVCLGGLVMFSRWQHRYLTERMNGIEYEHPARPSSALIVMVSEGPGSATALAAARYHGRQLKYLWLIHTKSSGPDAEKIARLMKEEFPETEVDQWQVHDDHTVQDVKTAVEALRQRLLRHGEIGPTGIVSDFTGLTKHASAGMVLACAQRKWRLEYVPPLSRDDRKRGLLPGTPIEVEVAYSVGPERDEWRT